MNNTTTIESYCVYWGDNDGFNLSIDPPLARIYRFNGTELMSSYWLYETLGFNRGSVISYADKNWTRMQLSKKEGWYITFSECIEFFSWMAYTARTTQKYKRMARRLIEISSYHTPNNFGAFMVSAYEQTLED